jgi:hypothetical protein
MQGKLDVIQCIVGSSPDVGPGTRLAECDDYTIFVELTVDPCQVPEARGGERLHLAVIVIEQGEIELLRFSPVAVAV